MNDDRRPDDTAEFDPVKEELDWDQPLLLFSLDPPEADDRPKLSP